MFCSLKNGVLTLLLHADVTLRMHVTSMAYPWPKGPSKSSNAGLVALSVLAAPQMAALRPKLV
jgi:hypothetical protein